MYRLLDIVCLFNSRYLSNKYGFSFRKNAIRSRLFTVDGCVNTVSIITFFDHIFMTSYDLQAPISTKVAVCVKNNCFFAYTAVF